MRSSLLLWVKMRRRAHQSNGKQMSPNEQSMSCQKNGIPRIAPQIRASGITARLAPIPNSITQMFFTGSL